MLVYCRLEWRTMTSRGIIYSEVIMIITNFYELPLNEEALMCEDGVELVIDRALLRAGSGVVRRCKVLSVEDTAEGRYVKFMLISET